MNKSPLETNNDSKLFIDIQVWKYFQSHGIEKFETKEDAKKIINKIIYAFNTQIAPEHERLANSNPEAKTAWFNSVEVDFTKEQ